MKRIIGLALLAFLTACFEQGSIEVQSDRVNVKIESDSQNVMAMVAEAFLRAERAMDSYFIEGFQRPVFFDSRSIVPDACTSELNCFTYIPEDPVQPEPEVRIVYRDRPEVERHGSMFGHMTIRNCGYVVSEPTPEMYEALNKARADYLRLGIDSVLFSEPHFCSSNDAFNTSPITIYDRRSNRIEHIRVNDGAFPDPRQAYSYGIKHTVLFSIYDFHFQNRRASCPTVDPIDWAETGLCV